MFETWGPVATLVGVIAISGTVALIIHDLFYGDRRP